MQMTKIRRVVAVLIAILMTFSSFSLLASAYTYDEDNPPTGNLEISTKIFKESGSEWVEAEDGSTVAPGDSLKVRVYISTDYYSASGDLLLFYDRKFFTPAYDSGMHDLADCGSFNIANTDYSANGLTALVGFNAEDDVTDEIGTIKIPIYTENNNVNVWKYDDASWLFELDMTVADTASTDADGIGKVYAPAAEFASLTNEEGRINFPYGEEGDLISTVCNMYDTNITGTSDSTEVTINNNVKFLANEGTFGEGADTDVDGIVNSAYTVPSISRTGYSLVGWESSSDEVEDLTYDASIFTMPYETGVTFTAQWEPIEATVRFYFSETEEIVADGETTADTAVIATITGASKNIVDYDYVTFGTDYTLPTVTAQGYIIDTWYDADGTKYTAGDRVAVTSTAQLKFASSASEATAEECTVTFDAGEGKFADSSSLKAVSCEQGASLASYIPAEPARTGYTFSGWDPCTDDVTVDGDMTFTAIWTVNTYTVTYKVGTDTYADYDIAYGEVIDVPEDPTVTGCDFDGWVYTKEGTDEKYTGTTMPTFNLVATAQTPESQRQVVYKVNGIAVDYDTLYCNTEYTVLGYSEEGYEDIAEWECNDGNKYAPNAKFTYDNSTNIGKIVFSATAEPKEYTVTFNVDGVKWKDTKIAYDSLITYSEEPSKEGYIFSYWDPADEYNYGDTMPAQDIAFDAVFTKKNDITVTYYSDEKKSADLVETFSNSVFGDDIDTPDDPTKTGYTFREWKYYKESDDTEYTGTTVPAYDIYALAQWDVINYNITFVKDNGEANETKTVPYGKTIADYEIASPTKTGYTFGGWAYSATEDSAAYAGETMPAYDLTATAQWTVNQYSITYKFNNGNGDEVAWYDFGTTPNAAPSSDSFSKTGYVFDDWYTDESWTTKFTVPAEMPAENLVAYAHWEEDSFTIEYDTNGGTEISDATVDFGDDIPSVDPAPTKTGYTLDEDTPFKYYMESSHKTEYQGTTMPAYKLYALAQWTPNNYTITFDLAGGDGTFADITAAYESDITWPTNEPTKTGYKFTGWSVGPYTTMPLDGATAVAQWTANTHKLTFICDNGEANVVYDTVPYGTSLSTYIPNVTKTGYDFNNWSPLVASAMPDEDVTYTATWTAKTVTTVKFMKNDGTSDVFEERTGQTYDSEIAAPATEPERSGYTFAGWSRSDIATEGESLGKVDSTDEIVFYAVWSQGTSKYTVEFYEMGTDGKYPSTATRSETKYGKTETTAIYEATSYEGFTPDTTYTDYVKSGEINADGNLVLKIFFKRNQSTIKYDTVEGSAIADKSVYFGSDLPKVTTSKTGYALKDPSFKYYKEESHTTEYTGTAMPDYNLYAVAQWKANTHKVTFNLDNGEADVVYNDVEYGTSLSTITPTPVKEGYTFKAWSPEVDATMPDNDVTYTATWTANNYTITFDLDGGDGTFADITAAYNAEITWPTAIPTKEGYTFTGWSVGPYTTMPLNGATVKAQWTANNYTITFDLDGGDGTFADITAAYNAEITWPTEKPTKEGYTFDGWSATYTTMPLNGATVKAQWTANNYTITFDLAGGKGTFADITAAYNAEITWPTAIPTKEGYTFTGWSTGTLTTMPLGGATATAQWSINTYKLTFVLNNGDADKVYNEVEYNTALSAYIPTDFTKTGYTFKAWSPEVDATMPDNDVTYTATWTANNYTITFDLDGGDGTFADITAAYESNITWPTAIPTKEGYTFTGWSTGTLTTMPLGGATAIAQWTAKTVTTVKFMKNDGTSDVFEERTGQTYDSEIAAPATEPERSGYTFAGWSRSDIATEGESLGKVDSTDEIVFYAVWSQGTSKYTVEFYEMGTDGKYPSTATRSETKYGKTETTATYEATSYEEFTPDEEYEYYVKSGEINAEGNLVLKIFYKRNQYTISYTTDGSAVADKQVYFGADLPEATTEKTGYTFEGWTYVKSGTTESYTDTTMPAYNLAATAELTPCEYSVKYFYDQGKTIATSGTADTAVIAEVISGGNVVNTDSATYDSDFTIPEVKVDGLVIKTWYGEDGTKYTAGQKVKNVFKFAASSSEAELDESNKHNATFYLNGGSLDGSTENKVVRFAEGAKIVAPDDPTKAGYTFDGWDPEPEGMTMGDEDIDFTAQWKANTYVVTYKVNGEYYDEYDITYGEDIDEPEEPDNTVIKDETKTFDKWVVGEDEAELTWESILANAVKDSATGKYTVTVNAKLKSAETTVAVKLVPVNESSTAMIERNGVVETWNEGLNTADIRDVTSIIEPNEDAYETPADYETYYVYGFDYGLTEANIADYVKVTGDGHYTVTANEKGGFGTGAIIKVYDKNDALIEQFYIVIFGDLDGNAVIDSNDVPILNKETKAANWSAGTGLKTYMLKAADLDGNNTIDSNDYPILNKATKNNGSSVNQKTGKKI